MSFYSRSYEEKMHKLDDLAAILDSRTSLQRLGSGHGAAKSSAQLTQTYKKGRYFCLLTKLVQNKYLFPRV